MVSHILPSCGQALWFRNWTVCYNHLVSFPRHYLWSGWRLGCGYNSESSPGHSAQQPGPKITLSLVQCPDCSACIPGFSMASLQCVFNCCPKAFLVNLWTSSLPQIMQFSTMLLLTWVFLGLWIPLPSLSTISGVESKYVHSVCTHT